MRRRCVHPADALAARRAGRAEAERLALSEAAQEAIDAFRAWMSVPIQPCESHPTQADLDRAQDAGLDGVVIAMAAMEDHLLAQAGQSGQPQPEFERWVEGLEWWVEGLE